MTIAEFKLTVKNVPEYAWNPENPYWVVNDCGDEGVWFYGAYTTHEKANIASYEESFRYVVCES